MGTAPSKLPTTHLTSTFPLAIPACSKPTTALFTCLETAAADHPTDPNIQTSHCAAQIAAYNTCTEKHINKRGNEKFKRIQERVPEEYRFTKSDRKHVPSAQ